MHRIIRSLLPALAVLALFSAQGCADREVPTAVQPEVTAAAAPVSPSFNTSASSTEIEKLATFRSRRSITIAWAKKWIGPEGGRLDFQGFAIDVPAGAVDKVTMFTINLPVDPKASERVVAEFGPHNKQFAVPVTIEFPFQGTSIEDNMNPTIVWWNDGWVDMGGWVTEDGSRIRTQTDHFSTYGTTDAEAMRGGTVTFSGG